MRPGTVFCCLTLFAAVTAFAQNYAPPEPVRATDEQLRAIKAKADKLEFALASLKKRGLRDPYLADIEIYHKAAAWIVRHGEFYKKEYVDATLEALDRGLFRASQQNAGESPWVHVTGTSVVRAYRSRLDNSVQPYAVTLPGDFGKDPSRRWRLDVVLHGRNATLTEATFLKTHGGDKPLKDRPYVQIDIYGRGNNAYRWAGESDVYEAMSNFLAVERLLGREQLIDPSKVILRGFSMGGAGTWHLGLHRPDQWAVLGPGAGFTVTRGYTPLPDSLPGYIESCLKIYDAVEYSENVFNVPVVAYSGDRDKQMQAAVNIENKLKGTNLSITHLVAPGLEHQFPPEWQAKAEKE
jgi:predicted esterase